MNAEILILGPIAIVLAGVIGYLIANSLKRSNAFHMENTLRNAQSNLETSLNRVGELERSAGALRQALQESDSECQKLQAIIDTSKQARVDDQVEIVSLKADLAKERDARYAAEKASSALQAQVEERNADVDQLKAALASVQKKYEDERKHYEHQFSLNRDLSNRAMEFEVRSAESHNKYLAAEERIVDMRTRLDELMTSHQRLVAEQAELKTKLDERERTHSERVALFEEHKRALGDQFRLLANDILDSKIRLLGDANQTNLVHVFSPFQQSLDEFKKEVNDIHHRQTTQQGELRRELDLLKDLNQKMTQDAQELAAALKGQKKTQGNWGELILDNVLDRSGLVRERDYRRFVTVHTDEGRRVPDVIVYLPQQKHIVIDAKVSLVAYTRFINAGDEQTRAQALNQHVTAMKERINELSNRAYHKIDGPRSPDIVFMFVPVESAFVEAMKADPELFQDAVNVNVLVATPTTLLTSLNIVRQLWRFEEQNRSIVELLRRAETMFSKMRLFLESFQAVKASLASAMSSVDEAESRLVRGPDNLVSQFQQIKRLVPSVREDLPSYFNDQAQIDDEDEKKNAA